MPPSITVSKASLYISNLVESAVANLTGHQASVLGQVDGVVAEPAADVEDIPRTHPPACHAMRFSLGALRSHGGVVIGGMPSPGSPR